MVVSVAEATLSMTDKNCVEDLFQDCSLDRNWQKNTNNPRQRWMHQLTDDSMKITIKLTVANKKTANYIAKKPG